MRSGIVVGFIAIAATATTTPDARSQGGDPIMPLSEVRPGMQCRAFSVFKGTDIDDFEVEILDVVGGDSGARLLVRVSGPEVDETGVGAGFSGSPIYCRGQDGAEKNAGAISETIGEYGGKTVLATPIEQIVNTPLDPPAGKPTRARSARALAAPISVRGLSNDLFLALQRAGRRHGRTIIQAPPTSLRQATPNPAGLRPGSAVSIGLSSGALSVGAIGTVAYTAGDKVWALGHPFDGVGRRSLFLQNAYVAAIIGNPVQLQEAGATYKLAGAMDDVGTITNDAFNAVVGRTGPHPPSIPVRIFTKDEDTGAQTTTEVRVADETDVGNPAGGSALSFVAPLAVTQAGSGILNSTPNRLFGTMCMRITLKERPAAIRICNRYVADGTTPGAPGGNVVALRAASDMSEVLTALDAYRPTGLHITEVSARISLRRGQHQAFMRKVTLPRRVRPGQRVTAKMTVQLVRERRATISFPVRIPSTIASGRRKLTFRGSDPDTADDDLFGTLTIELGEPEDDEQTEGATTLKALLREIRKTDRYDGIKLGGKRVYEHPDLRVGGRASATVTVRR